MSSFSPLIGRATRNDLWAMIASSRVPALRSMRRFAEQSLIIPEGKYKDTRWRADVLPYAPLLFEEMTSGRWTRFAVLGPVQGGKSFHGFVAPVLYHLFEMKEPVIFAAPTMQVCRDKWTDELLPAIRAAGYDRWLPLVGSGSQGGWSEEMRLTNGAAIKFMSGHGGDETRSSYTTRVCVVTEADKMDEAGRTSREADPVSQIEARMNSYDAPERRFYIECTVSIPGGRIWQEYLAGSRSRIGCPCPSCGQYVTPDREHLLGWQQAENKLQAARAAYFVCPSCQGKIDGARRRRMNLDGRLLHRGQQIDAGGRLVGPLPETDTLGFRWNAFNNLFWSIGSIAAKHWEKLHGEADEEKEKELCQFYWATPYEPPLLDVAALDFRKVLKRHGPQSWTKEVIPAEAKYLTLGTDVGKWLCWWVLTAWFEDGSGHVVDYGAFDVPSDSMAEPLAIMAALRDFRDKLVLRGWRTTAGVEVRVPDQVWIDARYQSSAVYAFIRESTSPKDQRFRPSLGYGSAQRKDRVYHRPKKVGNEVKWTGEDFHISWYAPENLFLVHIDADQYKSRIRDGLATPAGKPGAISFYASSDRNQHLKISKHLAAEEPRQERDPQLGPITVWVNPHGRPNHWFDCLYNARAAAAYCGLKLIKSGPKPAAAEVQAQAARVTMPDGRPFLVTERT